MRAPSTDDGPLRLVESPFSHWFRESIPRARGCDRAPRRFMLRGSLVDKGAIIFVIWLYSLFFTLARKIVTSYSARHRLRQRFFFSFRTNWLALRRAVLGDTVL